MRVLFLTFYFEPDLCAGSFRSSALAHEFMKNEDIHVDIVTTQPNRYLEYSQTAAPAQPLSKNIMVYRIKTPQHKSGILDQMVSFSYFFWGAYNLVKNNRYDVVYASSARLFTAVLGAKLARRFKKPLYIDVRDIFAKMSVQILAEKRLLFLQFVINCFERYAFSYASKINLVSEGFENYFKEKFPTKPLSFHSNGIDDMFLDMKLSRKQVNSRRLSILYAGNIGDGQGLHKIIPKLANELREIADIKIVGAGGRKKDLRNEIEKLGCTNVIIETPVGRDKLKSYYENCDILFLHLNDVAIFEEVLPSKIFEYAATGKPILAGVNGFARKFIKQHVLNCEVFDPCNTETCIVSLFKLKLEHTDRLEFIQQNLRSNIMEKMAIDIYETTIQK